MPQTLLLLLLCCLLPLIVRPHCWGQQYWYHNTWKNTDLSSSTLLAIFFMARGKSHQYLTHLETLYAQNRIFLCKLVPLESYCITGETKHFLIVFKAHFTRYIYLILLTGLKSPWLVIDSGGEPRDFILFKGHSKKLAPKFLSLYLYIS